MNRILFSVVCTVILFFIVGTKVNAQDLLMEVISPDSGEVFQVGKTITVKWNSLYKKENEYMNKTFPVRIELDRQVAPTQIFLADSIKDVSSFTWTIPDSLDRDTSCRIFVGAIGCPYAYNMSKTFTINCPDFFALKNYTKDTSIISGAFYFIGGIVDRISLNWIAKGTVPRMYDTYYKDNDSSTWNLIKENQAASALQWELKSDKKRVVQFKIATHTGTFTLYSGKITVLPTPIRIELPSSVSTSRPLFQWHPSDGAEKYIIEVNDALTGKIKPSFTDTVSDTFYTPVSELQEGTYYWRVVPYHANYTKISNLKECSHFAIKFMPPELIAPSINPTRDSKPLFVWQTTPSTSLYKGTFSTDSLFSSLIDSFSTTDTFYTPANQLPFGITYWKVVTQTGISSKVRKLTIVPDTLPLLKTFNGAELQVSKPEFSWSSAKDADTYKLVIYKQTQSLTKSTVGANPAVLLTKFLSDTFYTPTQEFPTGLYSWSVSSNKNFNEYTFADQFTIKTATTSVENAIEPHFTNNVIVHSSQGLQINADISSNSSLEVFDLNGKMVYSIPQLKSSILINTNSYSRGMYIIRVVSEARKQSVQTFIGTGQ